MDVQPGKQVKAGSCVAAVIRLDIFERPRLALSGVDCSGRLLRDQLPKQ
jgi:hypothetical protein